MSKTKIPASQARKKSAKTKRQPTHEEISLRAYHIFLERGGVPGNEREDWLQAERELLQQVSKPRRKSKIVPIAA